MGRLPAATAANRHNFISFEGDCILFGRFVEPKTTLNLSERAP
jgi:hypothetical protein